MNFLVASLALVVDRFLVLPNGITKFISHPVIWMGALIEQLEPILNNPQQSAHARYVNGGVMLAILLTVSLGITVSISFGLRLLPYSWVFEALLASIFLAHRSLHQAVHSVANSLDISIEAARIEVSNIVGRDTKNLDQHEISRAAIESLAENSSDGIIAPLFWLILFGLPGVVIYKAINTADSMVGYKNLRYAQFGWASAKIDDLVNWIPARLTAVLYVFAARFHSRISMRKSWNTSLRDAPNHVSPNAGWPEAALAGALAFSLGGARTYGGKTVELAPMGTGRRDLVALDIVSALSLSTNMSNLALGLTVLLATIRSIPI